MLDLQNIDDFLALVPNNSSPYYVQHNLKGHGNYCAAIGWSAGNNTFYALVAGNSWSIKHPLLVELGGASQQKYRDLNEFKEALHQSLQEAEIRDFVFPERMKVGLLIDRYEVAINFRSIQFQ